MIWNRVVTSKSNQHHHNYVDSRSRVPSCTRSANFELTCSGLIYIIGSGSIGVVNFRFSRYTKDTGLTRQVYSSGINIT